MDLSSRSSALFAAIGLLIFFSRVLILTDAYSFHTGTLKTPVTASSRMTVRNSINIEIFEGVSDNTHRSLRIPSRRSILSSLAGIGMQCLMTGMPLRVEATADCFSDCMKNCNTIAPKDPKYCESNCKDYCSQTDRTDGLSGSISSTGGETGILGTTTVVKGEDKPPQWKVPGLDFTSEKGRRLIGY